MKVEEVEKEIKLELVELANEDEKKSRAQLNGGNQTPYCSHSASDTPRQLIILLHQISSDQVFES